MEWEKVLADSVKNGVIKEIYLQKIPVLKAIDNWRSLELVGWVEHQMKHTYYKGGLVKLNGKIYFVQDKTIKALQEFMDWKFPLKIKVTTD